MDKTLGRCGWNYRIIWLHHLSPLSADPSASPTWPTPQTPGQDCPSAHQGSARLLPPAAAPLPRTVAPAALASSTPSSAARFAAWRRRKEQQDQNRTKQHDSRTDLHKKRKIKINWLLRFCCLCRLPPARKKGGSHFRSPLLPRSLPALFPRLFCNF